ncbi:serine/threonine protein kinase [Ruminococcus difficilis]|uniref:non-specific serine/threonine protein kinase n=1 Tax=Ruminococcus difficilis TaxID=2763069 RepID=A0A935C1M7_9FIRM|nr:serine/threonine protein kinase [Ruminococcus difficilis]MBK6088756.1 serine/threonine protein kinase [Ruminococcus difficilis]
MSRLGVIIDNTYQLTEYINRGGMSIVYLAENIRLGNRWAVKEIVKTNDEYNRLYIDALIHEANMMKDLDYPAFPRIVDIIEDDYALYLVMDYIEGKTLEEILFEEGPQPEERVIGWGVQLCDAMSYLHNQPSPIIYRDMKPSNVIMKPDGSLRIIDFGVARVFHPEKTNDTVALGTKGFAPPEQYVGQTDERSDIYALGATMRYLLTGVNPRSNEAVDYPALYAQMGLSDKMIRILDKCTAINPADRYQTDSELCEALTEDDQAVKLARKMKKMKIILLVAAIVVFVIGLSVTVYSLVGIRQQEIIEATENAAPQLAVVPNLVGKTYEEAKALLEKEGLTCEKTESYNATVKKGVVISQDKRPNEVLEKGSKIVLTVSLGEEGETTEAEAEESKEKDSSESSSKSSSSNSSSNGSDDDNGSDSDSSRTSHSAEDNSGGGSSGSSSGSYYSPSSSASGADSGSASGADSGSASGADSGSASAAADSEGGEGGQSSQGG